MDQHVPAPNEVNTPCLDGKPFDVAAHKLDEGRTLFALRCHAKWGQNQVDPNCPAPEPSGQFKAVVTTPAANIKHNRFRIKIRRLCQIEQKVP
jgi:hypothetical protein